MPVCLVARLRFALQKDFLSVRLEGFHAVSFANEALQSANAYRAINCPAPAAVLAWRGTDAPAGGGKGIGGARHFVGFLIIPFGDELDVLPSVRMDGAGCLAGNHPFPEFNIRDNCRVTGSEHSALSLRPGRRNPCSTSVQMRSESPYSVEDIVLRSGGTEPLTHSTVWPAMGEFTQIAANDPTR